MASRSPIIPVAVTADATIRTGAGQFYGLAVGGTDATVITVHDGTSSSAPIIGRFQYAANTSVSFICDDGIRCVTGLHFEVVSGGTGLTGAVYHGT